jgi:tRNA G10  N-methylase Trm11
VSEFTPKSICILGRQPAIGLAELESLYGAEHILPLGGSALLDIDAGEINFRRLGGTIKVARILTILDTNKWPELEKYLTDNIPSHLQYVPEGKFTLGLSVYGLKVPVGDINRGLLNIKKEVKKTGRAIRVVPNKTPELNSAQVLHNKLTTQGAWELLFVADGKRTLLAQTFFVQDIEAYAARDQARPKRDSRVGMLPPKLAQTLINLTSPADGGTILDPFCGTGVVLQEAILMGYATVGTDIDERMVKYSMENMEWLKRTHEKATGSFEIGLADATNFKWSPFSVVVSEVFLGRPLVQLPKPDDLRNIIQDANTVIKKFLRNLAPQLKKDQAVCLAVPAWRKADGSFIYLPLIDRLTDMGYNNVDLKHVRREDLVYFREDQIVARQIIRLRKA